MFKRLDVASFEEALQGWEAQTLDRRTQQLALDGKALRGIHGDELPADTPDWHPGVVRVGYFD